MTAHKQVPIKVNAWVDEGVYSLVHALNEFPNVITVDSCEGYDGEPACVYFKVNGASEDHALFADKLASALNGEIDGRWFYAVRVEWRSDEPMIQILVSKPHIKDLGKILEATASRLRKRASGRGSYGTAPRNSRARRSRQHLAR